MLRGSASWGRAIHTDSRLFGWGHPSHRVQLPNHSGEARTCLVLPCLFQLTTPTLITPRVLLPPNSRFESPAPRPQNRACREPFHLQPTSERCINQLTSEPENTAVHHSLLWHSPGGWAFSGDYNRCQNLHMGRLASRSASWSSVIWTSTPQAMTHLPESRGACRRTTLVAGAYLAAYRYTNACVQLHCLILLHRSQTTGACRYADVLCFTNHITVIAKAYTAYSSHRLMPVSYAVRDHIRSNYWSSRHAEGHLPR